MESNFMQQLKLRGEDDPRISDWIKKKTDKYTSGAMQNEMIRVMSLKILREVACALQKATYYTIMIDETADISNQEQVVVCFRWVSDDFEVHEDFLGMYAVDSIDARSLLGVIHDVLKRLNLSISKVRGQCYDGVSAMSGSRGGVVKMIQDEEPRAIYTHCYGHSLNLACCDMVKHCKIMKDALDITLEITKLIKKSPMRDAIFERIKKEMSTESPGIRVLCPTRWTIKAESLQSILSNYAVLLRLWEESLEVANVTEMKARILGVAAQMGKFDFYFGVKLGGMIFQHCDNPSRTLQLEDISAAEGQEIAAMTNKTLAGLRSDSNFDLFWIQVNKEAEAHRLSAPRLPRNCSSASGDHGENLKARYKQMYFEALDLITTCINQRFDQPGHQNYKILQELLTKTVNGEAYDSELKFLCDFYGEDICESRLRAQLETLASTFQDQDKTSLADVITFFRSSSSPKKVFLSEVGNILKLLLVMPAMNATSERSFSSLRRIKTYLRSTMSQPRLNHLMILHVHKDHTDQLSLVDTANEFIKEHDHREHIFGKFTINDLS